MTHLRIENQNSNVEIVNAAIILKLYEMALSAEGDVLLKGNLLSDHAKLTAYDYLTGNLPDTSTKRFPNLTINLTGGAYIDFADPEVERVLLANNIGDGTGITESRAKSTIISTLFMSTSGLAGSNANGQVLTYFDEFLYFKGVTSQYNVFYGCKNLKSVIFPDGWRHESNKANEFCAYCTNLEFVSLPASINFVGYGSFDNCSKLATVVFRGSTPPTISSYGRIRTQATIVCPDDATTAYATAFPNHTVISMSTYLQTINS